MWWRANITVGTWDQADGKEFNPKQFQLEFLFIQHNPLMHPPISYLTKWLHILFICEVYMQASFILHALCVQAFAACYRSLYAAVVHFPVCTSLSTGHHSVLYRPLLVLEQLMFTLLACPATVNQSLSSPLFFQLHAQLP